jgi:hypothetical protein
MIMGKGDMMPKLPRTCPSCNSHLVVTQLCCTTCGTEVHGNYEPDLFSRLSNNDFDFIVLFVKTKGNIKEMERELKISYWTIRAKLNEIINQLGFETEIPNPEDQAASRQEILEQLNEGALTVKQAAELLEKLKFPGKSPVT